MSYSGGNPAQPGYPGSGPQSGYPGSAPQPTQGQSYPGGQSYPYPQAVPSNGYPPTGYPQPGTATGYPQSGNLQPGAAPGYPQPGAAPGYPQPGTTPGYPQAGAPSGYPQPTGGTGYPQPGGGYAYPQPGMNTGYPQACGGTGYPQPNAAGYPQAAAGYPTSAPQSGPTVYPIGATGYPQQPPSGYAAHAIAGGPGIMPPSKFSTKVELTIKCHNLIDRDFTSKSDPLAAVFVSQGNQWFEKGRTESIKNTHNPTFSHKVVVDYLFEETQRIRFDIYDVDNQTKSLKDDDFLGCMESTLGQIVSSSPFTKPLVLRSGSKLSTSTITVFAEEVEDAGSQDTLEITFKAKNLDNKDFMGKSDPFLEILKPGLDGSWQMAHRTEVINNNLNPNWKTITIPQRSLGGNNPSTQILMSCFDKDGDGSHDLIGECVVTLGEILEGQRSKKSWPLMNKKKQQKKGKSYKNSGELLLEFCKVTKSYSFLDFILGGTQINMIVAVDFTMSNGDPRDVNSLHFQNPNQPNEYIRAIQAVGTVIQDYDSDKMFPALGFGAKIPPDYKPSFEFALNFNMSSPFCSGVQGLISAYQNCLMQIQLYGPTNFEPVIKHCMRFAHQAQMQPTAENYYVLLILTDGDITDLYETTDAIVEASYFPMSIIIVGVGNDSFSKMDFLDGDGGHLKSRNGKIAVRDIVQFVPFSKYRNFDPSFLAREVLAEIPKQMTDHYRQRGLHPKPKRQNLESALT